jgi:non-specific serine/threonine protein kinase
VRFAEEAAPHVFRSDRKHWFDRLEADHDNLRASQEWAVAHGDVDLGLRMSWAAWRFWQARGHLHEAKRRVDETLMMEGGELRLRAKALEACGGISWWQGDMDTCRRVYEQALEMQRSLGDPAEIANALYNYGLAYGFGLNLPEEALAVLDEAEAIYEQLGDVGGLADVSWGKANVAIFVDDDGELARRLLKRSLELYQQVGNEFGMGWALFEYGEAARRSAMYDEARDHLHRGLRLFHSQDDVSGEVFFLAAFAGLEQATGDQERAVRLAGAAQNLRHKSGADLINFDVNLIEGLHLDQLESLTGELGEAYRQGTAMSREEAVAYALRT